MTEQQALEAVTINPALIAGIEDRVGSLETGKHADMVLLDGDPLSATAEVVRVFIDGQTVFAKEMEF